MALWQSRKERSENGRTINDREHNGPANGGIGRNKRVKGMARQEKNEGSKVSGDSKRQDFSFFSFFGMQKTSRSDIKAIVFV